MHRLVVLPLCLALGACQSPNPYRAESLPLPPAPPEAATAIDRGTYPAPPRDYARYRAWTWRDERPPDAAAGLTSAQVQEALSAALDQRGLRPARPGAAADLQVSATVRSERRVSQVYDDDYGYPRPGYGAWYGGGRYWDDYGMWGSAPIVRRYEYDVLAVRIELFDAADGQQVWSGYGESEDDGGRSERADALRQAIRRAMEGFPP